MFELRTYAYLRDYCDTSLETYAVGGTTGVVITMYLLKLNRLDKGHR